MAFLFWLIARAMGGKASFAAIFSGVGFISAIFILSNLIRWLPYSFEDELVLVSGGVFISSIALIWTIFLSMVLVREANDFTNARALIAVAAPGLVVLGSILFAFS